jgi:hypothetical protein
MAVEVMVALPVLAVEVAEAQVRLLLVLLALQQMAVMVEQDKHLLFQGHPQIMQEVVEAELLQVLLRLVQVVLEVGVQVQKFLLLLVLLELQIRVAVEVVVAVELMRRHQVELVALAVLES